MKVNIVGIEDRSYVDKETGELKESVALFYTKANKADKSCGCVVGYEIVTAKAFPEEFEIIKKNFEKLLGKVAIISKDTRTFKGSTYAVLDELEILV